MGRTFIHLAIFTVVIVALFMWVGKVITDISGGARRGSSTAAGISPEAGEALFWGQGKCHTCHSIGTQGSAVRGPNLGESEPFPLAIGVRAEARAQERTKQTGTPYTAADYLLECMIDPAAYVVEGFKNEMPVIWKPPIALDAEEIKALVAYLQSQGGTVDTAAMSASHVLEKMPQEGAGATALAQAWRPYLEGDPEAGKALFFDLVECVKCHAIKGEGGNVGPELTMIAGTRDPPYIVESIVNPSAVIASGFEPYQVITKDGRSISGVKKAEDEHVIVLMDSQGELHRIPKSEAQKIDPQPLSIMPGNFAELLTIKDFHDLLAFLLTLKGE